MRHLIVFLPAQLSVSQTCSVSVFTALTRLIQHTGGVLCGNLVTVIKHGMC